MSKQTSSRELTCETSDEDREIIKFYSMPAHHETIAAHLVRLMTHKHLKGDQTQKGFLISDYTKRLMAEKTREIDLFFACDFFVEDDSSEFFPTYAKLRKALK